MKYENHQILAANCSLEQKKTHIALAADICLGESALPKRLNVASGHDFWPLGEGAFRFLGMPGMS